MQNTKKSKPASEILFRSEYIAYLKGTNLTKAKKIYFTVKTRLNTFYYESDCKDTLAEDYSHIVDMYYGNWGYTVINVTISNQLPKGILI